MHYVNSADGTQIAYESTGTGPALIYISGAICHRRFQPILDDVKTFSNHYTVYNYDRRGRGDSSDNEFYCLNAEVEDVCAIIEASGGEAFVYGHSSGAVLALETALAYPDKVKKVITYDVPYTANKAERDAFLVTEQDVRSLIKRGKYGAAVRHFLLSIGTPWFLVYLMRLIPGWGRTVLLAPTLLYDIEMTKDNPPLERLAKIEVPTLLLVGEKSPVNIRNVSMSIAEATNNAQFEIVAKQDHMVSAKALLAFMERFLR